MYWEPEAWEVEVALRAQELCLRDWQPLNRQCQHEEDEHKLYWESSKPSEDRPDPVSGDPQEDEDDAATDPTASQPEDEPDPSADSEEDDPVAQRVCAVSVKRELQRLEEDLGKGSVCMHAGGINAGRIGDRGAWPRWPTFVSQEQTVERCMACPITCLLYTSPRPRA